MRVTRLVLAHFRNYAREEVRPSPGANLFLGGNAQGKSNLIEAVALLSTTRSFRTAVDRHLINRAFLDEPIVHARLLAEVEGGPHRTIELVITQEAGDSIAGPPSTRKHLRLDGVSHRLLDALGVLPTVLFTPDDVSLVGGAPSGRRRFLDVLLCQASRDYCRALSLYNRCLTQRNHLLRLIRRRRSEPDQLLYWDRLLAENGVLISRQRGDAIARMSVGAVDTHEALARGERLTLTYLPSTPLGETTVDGPDPVQRWEQAYQAMHETDLDRGVTTAGPHRDDVAVEIDGMEAASYASRGQMRTAALTLRLVEADYLRQELGRRPVLLFDDVMSELDAARRRALEQVMLDSSQSLITGLDQEPFSCSFLRAARVFAISAGRVELLRPPGEDAGTGLPADGDTPEG
ncbi:MAG: DNA replication/repair protein RecF [Anaerolineae bacterium]|nr:DNA replication/repair protein RecF [Anaerolineae bacterium]